MPPEQGGRPGVIPPELTGQPEPCKSAQHPSRLHGHRLCLSCLLSVLSLSLLLRLWFQSLPGEPPTCSSDHLRSIGRDWGSLSPTLRRGGEVGLPAGTLVHVVFNWYFKTPVTNREVSGFG